MGFENTELEWDDFKKGIFGSTIKIAIFIPNMLLLSVHVRDKVKNNILNFPFYLGYDVQL